MKWHLVVDRGCRKGLAIPITANVFRIGRDKNCQLRPASLAVQPQHCTLTQRHGHLFVTSGSSEANTFVNDRKIESVVELRAGDRLAIGPIGFVVNAVPVQEELPRPSAEEAIGEMLLNMSDAAGPGERSAVSSDETISETAALSLEDTGPNKPVRPSTAAPKTPTKDTCTAAHEILRDYFRRPTRSGGK